MIYSLSSETQLVETRKTNHPGYLHIPFQIGPQGEIKKSYCLDIVWFWWLSVLSRLSAAAFVYFSLWFDSVRLSCKMALNIVEDFDTKFR